MAEGIVRPRDVVLPGRSTPAQVFVGGDGPALLLLHGGWGDASLHWSRVWDRLAERYQVIAPELPGFGPQDHAPCGTVPEYVGWLLTLLDQLGIDRAHCVGNSFGASLAWSLAGRAPDRCAGLILVNGPPMPRTPAPMLWAGRTRLGRALMRAIFGRMAFHPSALRRAFVDPRKAPAGLAELLPERGDRLLSNFVRVIIEGDGPPPPQARPLLLWGADDRLPQTSAAAARRLHASLPGSTLRLLPDAGHFPQLEAPEAFVGELKDFIASSDRPARARQAGA